MRFAAIPLLLAFALPACAAEPADAPEVVASNQDELGAIWVDDQFVYWSSTISRDSGDTTSVMKAPQQGGAATVVSHAPASGRSAETRDATFWLANAQVRMFPKAGGDMRVFQAPADAVWFAANETDLVFAAGGDYGDMQIQAISLAGGPLHTIESGVSSYAYALLDGEVWWAERWQAIKRLPVAGGEPVEVTRIKGSPLTMIFDAQNVYFNDYGLAKAPRSGGPATSIPGGSAVEEGGLKLRNGRFWWSVPAWHEDHYAPGYIECLPIDGGSVTRVAEGDFVFDAFDVGTDRVFWLAQPLHEVLAKKF